MLQKNIQRLIKEVAEKHNIHPSVIEHIWRTQFIIAREEIESATLENPESLKVIRFKYLGTLRPNKKRATEIWEQLKNRQNEKNSQASD